MKKIVSLLLALVLAFSLFACTTQKTEEAAPAVEDANVSSNPVDGEKTIVKFWSFHSNDEQVFWQKVADEYNKVQDNVEVVVEFIPQADYLTTSLTTAFAANAAPDVFFMSPGDFMKYVNSGIAMDLSNYFTDEIKADFLKSSLDGVTVDGKVYGVPFEIELLGLYYNEDMLNQAGVAVPKTWDELIDATAKLTTADVSGLVIEPTKGYYQNFTWYPFLWQGGGSVLNSATKKSEFNSEATIQALQLYKDLVDAGAPTQLATGTWSPFVGDGSAAMQICGTWILSALENDYSDKNIKLAPIPIPEGGVAATDAGGWKLMVNGQSKVSDEAAKFVMWAMAENIDLPLEWCTKTKFAFSPRTSVLEAGADVYDQGLRKQFRDEIYASAIPEPRYPVEIVDVVGEAIQEVMFGVSDATAAAQKADEKIQTILDEYNGAF